MPDPHLEIQILAALVAAACALPGVFLVLRRMALLSDAISHVLLLGIVVAFLITKDLHSPLLFAGAALSGVATVALVEALQRTRHVKEDAAIGLVFPALFSAAVILVSQKFGNVHLDTDAVLLGELAVAPFRRLEFAGIDVPYSLVVMAVVLFVNLVFVTAFYKELKLATFDAALAAALGFAPAVLHYALMTLVSVTAVAAFDAVGSVLVVALMIVPAATAYLLTDRLGLMLVLAVGIGIAGALAGIWLADVYDANYAGAMATALGGLFGLAFLFAPQRGVVAQAVRRARQRRDFARTMLAVHLFHHEHTAAEAVESRVESLPEHLRWPPATVARVLRGARRRGLVTVRDGQVELTAAGRALARETLTRPA
jgi:manganese/zinc/iron transport system permease protein